MIFTRSGPSLQLQFLARPHELEYYRSDPEASRSVQAHPAARYHRTLREAFPRAGIGRADLGVPPEWVILLLAASLKPTFSVWFASLLELRRLEQSQPSPTRISSN